MAKEGSTVSGLMDSFATTVSVALQYGVPLRDLVNKFAHVRFEPSGFTGNSEIPIAKSIVDYIFRWLGSRFLTDDDKGSPAAAPAAAADANSRVLPGRPALLWRLEHRRDGAAALDSGGLLRNEKPPFLHGGFSLYRLVDTVDLRFLPRLVRGQ